MSTTAPTAPADTLAGTYTIDQSHSRLGFSARHAMVTKVRGQFTDYEGSGRFDADNPTDSRFEVTIKANSIDTNSPDRDAHLRSNDFLDMANHPTVTFVSTAIEQLDEDDYRVTGDLTIRGVTRPVTLDLATTGAAVDPFGNQRIGLEGSTTISRKQWGLNWNAALEAGGVLVSDKVTLEFDISAIRTEAA